MKVVLSAPDDEFERADRLAKSLKWSRSQLCRVALGKRVACHPPDQVIDAMDRVSAGGGGVDGFLSSAVQRVVERSE